MGEQYRENLKRLMNREGSTPNEKDIIRYDEVGDGEYIPAASGNWGSVQPTTIGAALDQLAAACSGLMP